MPLPKPSSGESRSDFMSRCLSDAKIVNEFSDQAQRVAVCMTQYEGKKMTDEPIENPDVEVETEVEFKNEQLDVSFEVKTSDDDEQQGMFSGYGSIFNNKDLGNDVVMQGAFAQSIGRKGAKAVKLLYQHKQRDI